MRYFILILALLVTGCASYSQHMPDFLSPYKLAIQQGNVVTPKMMLQLRPGMTKAQVSFIMGTPLLTDSFHAGRWDYFYQMQKDGKVIDQRRIILEFEGNLLKSVRGDVIPTDKGDGSMTVKPIIEPKSDLLIYDNKDKAPRDDGKSWLDKLKFWKSDNKTEPANPATAPVASPPAKAQQENPQAAPAPAPETKPEPAAEPAPASEAKPEAEPAPAPEAQPEPTPATPPAPEAKPEAAPVPAPETQPEPAPAPEPAPVPEAKPEAAPAPAPETQPEPAPAPAPEAKPEAAPVPAPKPAPAPAPSPVPAAKPETVPAPAPVANPVPEADKVAPKPKDLPPEDAPDYFERMLEKIGF